MAQPADLRDIAHPVHYFSARESPHRHPSFMLCPFSKAFALFRARARARHRNRPLR